MAVVAITPHYRGEFLDGPENYLGHQLLYIGWEDHTLFCSPICVRVSPSQSFQTLMQEILPDIYGYHPDWSLIDWRQVIWTHSGIPFMPVPERSLQANGLQHKSVIRLRTPGLTGIEHSYS